MARRKRTNPPQIVKLTGLLLREALALTIRGQTLSGTSVEVFLGWNQRMPVRTS